MISCLKYSIYILNNLFIWWWSRSEQSAVWTPCMYTGSEGNCLSVWRPIHQFKQQPLPPAPSPHKSLTTEPMSDSRERSDESEIRLHKLSFLEELYTCQHILLESPCFSHLSYINIDNCLVIQINYYKWLDIQKKCKVNTLLANFRQWVGAYKQSYR